MQDSGVYHRSQLPHRNDDSGSLLKSALTFRREDLNPEAEILKPVYSNRCDQE